MPVFDTLTTRMPNGLTNAAPWQTMGAAGSPDPTWAHQYANDFDTFTAGDWTITLVGTGTQALTDYNGGALLVSNTAGATDATYMTLKNASFQLANAKAQFFKIAGQISDVNCAFWAGLVQKGATTIASITDGVYITKAAGSTQLVLNSKSAAAANSVSVNLPTSLVLANATYFELGIMVDAKGNVAAFFNPTTGSNPISAASAASTQPRGRVAALYASGQGGNGGTPVVTSNVLLTPGFGFLNNTAAARTFTVDYIAVSDER